MGEAMNEKWHGPSYLGVEWLGAAVQSADFLHGLIAPIASKEVCAHISRIKSVLLANLEQHAPSDEHRSAELGRLRADYAALRALAASAMSEIDEEHRPDTLTTTPRGGCVMCWPKDGSWPCASNLAMSDLRAWLAAHPVGDES